MSVPVNLLKPDQRFWYAQLVVAAILADGEIDASEVEFLRGVIGVVKEPVARQALLAHIEAKQPPPVHEPPSAIPDQILAAIFTELILICIADVDFAVEERTFLEEVAGVMSFTPAYLKMLMNWLEDGLRWKRAQSELLPPSSGFTIGQVPIDQFSSEQRYWYAQLLISTIMLDGRLDEMELQFMKMAVGFVQEKPLKMKLMGYVKNKMSPPLSSPPDFPRDLLILIFVNVIQIVSADESISYSEQTMLKELSDLCGFESDLFARLISWCNQGVSWKGNKNGLIQRVRRSV
ncbi:MAG: hypothetical protein RRB13_11140 [bacterium]|nr:hypothetical protein [bacterium]